MLIRQTARIHRELLSHSYPGLLSTVGLSAIVFCLCGHTPADALTFTPGDLVVSVEGDGGNTASSGTGATGNTGADSSTYLDNQAAPLWLYEYLPAGTNQPAPVGALELPTASSGNNSVISGEYGSSSEATLQLTGNGQYLTIAGYGVNAANYNKSYDLNGTGTALAQSCSLSGTACGGTPQVSRVIGLIGANGGVNTSTVLYNVYNENNPRSVYSANGTSFYISGQGTGNVGDKTGGVFYVPTLGPGQTAVPITGQDASSNTVSQDTRDVQIYNNQLYVSVDSKEGSGNNRDFIGTLGSPPATSTYNSQNGPTQLPGFGNNGGTGKVTITTGSNSDGNSFNAGKEINLSPENYFFANPDTLYVADSGDPKNNSVTNDPSKDNPSTVGDGGLQKWSLNTATNTWSLDYTLTAGLQDFVENSTADPSDISGTTGLLGLTGELIDNGTEVELFATNYTIGDTDQTYLYGITDLLSATLASQVNTKSFGILATAPADSNFKGVSFAPQGASPLTPTPLAPSWSFMLIGLAGFGLITRRRRSMNSFFFHA